MALSNHDQTRIREYLLGHLSDEELTKLEERLMVEDDLFEELEISKGELIEEYCAGELNQDDRRWFEHNYLASTEGRQLHALSLAIGCLKHPQPLAQKPVKPQPSFFEKLAALFTSPRWAVPAMSAVLVLVIAGIWLRSRQPRTIVTVALTNTQLSRSNGGESLPPKLNLSPDVAALTALLTLPKSFPQGTRFQALLDNQIDRRQVKVVDHKDNVITVTIPAADLPRGEYALELTALKSDGTEEAVPGNYRFEVN